MYVESDRQRKQTEAQPFEEIDVCLSILCLSSLYGLREEDSQTYRYTDGKTSRHADKDTDGQIKRQPGSHRARQIGSGR